MVQDPNWWRGAEQQRREKYNRDASVATGDVLEYDYDFELSFLYTPAGYVVTVKRAGQIADVLIPDEDGLFEVKGRGPAVLFRLLTQEQYERWTALRMLGDVLED